MRAKKYFTMLRAGIIAQMQFRIGTIVTVIGNIIYLIIIYFLWKAIYESVSTEAVNGMTFNDTMIYLVLASSLFYSMELYHVWTMGYDIQSGKIILDLLKPMKYDSFIFWMESGRYVFNFMLTFLPTAIIVYIVTHGALTLGINLVFFFISVVMAILINYFIDLFTGTICIHTESIWGVNIMKEVIVLLLSGATVPIAFFPEPFRTITYYLPFQAIYNTPLRLLTDMSLSLQERFEFLGLQLIWIFAVIIMYKLFWKVSIRKIMVNGG